MEQTSKETHEMLYMITKTFTIYRRFKRNVVSGNSKICSSSNVNFVNRSHVSEIFYLLMASDAYSDLLTSLKFLNRSNNTYYFAHTTKFRFQRSFFFTNLLKSLRPWNSLQCYFRLKNKTRNA